MIVNFNRRWWFMYGPTFAFGYAITLFDIHPFWIALVGSMMFGFGWSYTANHLWPQPKLSKAEWVKQQRDEIARIQEKIDEYEREED